MRKLQILFLFLALSLPNFSLAKAVYCTNCSTQYEQVIEKATALEQLQQVYNQLNEQVQQTAQQIHMVQQNIEQYENMMKNTLSLPQDIKNKLQNEYNRLGQLYKDVKTNNGNIEGLRNKYNSMFSSYEQVKEGAGTNYQENWSNWSEMSDTASRSTFEQSGRQLEELSNSNDLDSYINQLLTNPEGRMEAAQAGNQLSALQIQEMRELRALMATSAQEQAIVNSKKEQQDKAEREFIERVYAPRENKIDLSKIINEPVY